jgi:flavodoxin
MKIGIIVHSATGNTLSVAEKLREALANKGHAVSLERVTAMNDDPRAEGGSRLKDAPDVGPYDAFVFAAPVWGFSLSTVMKTYLAQLPSLSGKRAGCFVTQQLSHAWLGGNHAIRQMKGALKAKGAEVFSTGVVGWSCKEKEEQINRLIEKLAQIF